MAISFIGSSLLQPANWQVSQMERVAEQKQAQARVSRDAYQQAQLQAEEAQQVADALKARATQDERVARDAEQQLTLGSAQLESAPSVAAREAPPVVDYMNLQQVLRGQAGVAEVDRNFVKGGLVNLTA